MSNPPLPGAATLAERYRRQSAKIESEFFTSAEGLRATRARSHLVDRTLQDAYTRHIRPTTTEPRDFCLVALGGYGREELFPYSDIDLLLLFRRRVGDPVSRDQMSDFLRELWDLKLQLGHSTHPLRDCSRYHAENLEFNISLLDARYLAGDHSLFVQLTKESVPRLMRRAGLTLLRDLTLVTEDRHRRNEDTIYHLEPNVKSCPGGLRDLQVAGWIAQILHLEERGTLHPGSELVAKRSPEAAAAKQFLFDVRTYLHYLGGRDQNTLTYARQEELAGMGSSFGPTPEDWMREYFRQARVVHALVRKWKERSAAAHASLLTRLQDRRTGVRDGNFRITRGKLYFRRPLPFAPDLLLELFQVVARHGAGLRPETERWIRDHLSQISQSTPDVWSRFRGILTSPFAYDALVAMHQTGVLVRLFPEFRFIDCLVIRDFYHRYTVDEHSLLTIKHFHDLNPSRRRPTAKRKENALLQSFREIYSELEQAEILLFVLLFHDVGKGVDPDRHVEAGGKIVEQIMQRLEMSKDDRKRVRFLIENHLEMSATLMRRDFSRDDAVRQFADRVATADRLRMLTLLTYVDIQSVNPSALTSWKQEQLWQLYMATYNELTHTVHDDRYGSQAEHPQMQSVIESLRGKADPEALKDFLEGFPWHYLRTHSDEEVLEHFRLARNLARRRVEIYLVKKGAWYSLVVLTADRPSLFAQITGVLSAFGMNILKADAFANQRRMILDSFLFEDPNRNFELNPTELVRFQHPLRRVIEGKIDLRKLLAGRRETAIKRKTAVKIPTEILFDNEISPGATVLEIFAPDRPALLHDIGRTLAKLGCNLEVALIDTEGGKAIDVFYLTHENAKLSPKFQARVRKALRKSLP